MRRVVVGWHLGAVCLEDLAVPNRTVADEPRPFDLELVWPRNRRAIREHLAPACVDHGAPSDERVQRRDARDRHVKPERKTPGGREPDPEAGEAPGACPHDEAVNLARREARRPQQLVRCEQHVAGLCPHLVARLAVPHEAARRTRRGGVKGEDRLHW